MKRATTLLFAAIALVVSLGHAARADEAADELKAKMTQAYRDTKTHEAVVRFEIRQNEGRWSKSQSTDFRLAYDAAGKKLKVDKPEILIVSDGQKMRLKADELPGRHAEIDVPEPLDYTALTEAVPFAVRPPLPELQFLLSADPLATLTNSMPYDAKALEPDAQKRPGLLITTTMGKTTIRLDPATHLASTVVVEINIESMGGAAGDSASLHYDVDVKKHNQPLDADAFAFDTTNSTAAPSIEEWVGGGANAGGEQGHPLVGQAAPPLAIKNVNGEAFNLADEKAKVIVLDFWATWCPPCREGLPKIQAVAEWAKQNDKSVAVYTVNVREDAEQVKKFAEEFKLTLPVLMDADGAVSDAYGVQGIPQTVVISGGKVVHVHVGLSPDMEALLKGQIDALLTAQ